MNMLSKLFGKKSGAPVPPIVAAVKKGNIRKVRQLLETGVCVESRDEAGQNLLILAVHTGERNLVRLLLEYGADPDSDYGNPLHFAATNGNIGMIALLLENGADIDQQSAFGQQTALHLASYKGHADVVRYLIEKGANPDLRDRNNETPLAFAKKHELHECVSILERAAR
jgi:uncharacterized protein